MNKLVALLVAAGFTGRLRPGCCPGAPLPMLLWCRCRPGRQGKPSNGCQEGRQEARQEEENKAVGCLAA